MSPFIKKIVRANVRVLLYYGDTDMACNFMMGQQFAAGLGFKVIVLPLFPFIIKKISSKKQPMTFWSHSFFDQLILLKWSSYEELRHQCLYRTAVSVFQRQLKKTAWKFDKQIAGFKTLYEGLTFITVRGAGHMAPQWRAPEMQYAIQQFLLNHPIWYS